jgi:hypothetical protein
MGDDEHAARPHPVRELLLVTALWLAHPVLTIAVIVVTGNHY